MPQPKTRSRRQFLSGVSHQQAQRDPHDAHPYYTPAHQFFQQHTGSIPDVNLAHWSLTVGEYPQSATFGYDDIHEMSSVARACVIACAGNNPQRRYVGNALWRGVRFDHLLRLADISPTKRYAQFYSADGYITSLPVDALKIALLAYEMNGEPLRHEHGFPLRLIAPGYYGYKMPKWVGRVEFTNQPIAGIWERDTHSETAILHTDAAIQHPLDMQVVEGAVMLSGIAYGASAITDVELNINGGAWMPVDSVQQQQYGWAQWQIVWQPPVSGEYRIAVRAHDNGATVTSSQSHHAITVRVLL